jgi:hypothetical protein
MESSTKSKTHLTFGYYSSLLLSLLTLLAFGLAMMAIPPSGPHCPENCMEYPFSGLLLYFPRDYYWMYVTVFQLFAFVIFMVSNHYVVSVEKKLFTSISIAFALVSANVLLIAYFTQFSVVPVSMMKGETEGIALITQYNENGLFIAMEELGFICMSIALLFLGFAFSGRKKPERTIRFILMIPFVVTVASFLLYSITYGLFRSYRFEVAAISVNWLVIIVVGLLIGIYRKKELNT